MTETWCIENDFAAQRELAVIEEARSFREIEKLRAQLAASEQRVKAMEDALREIRDYDPHKSPNAQLNEIYIAAWKESDSCHDCARIRKANWLSSGLCTIHYGKVTRAREAVDSGFEHNQKYEPQNIARRALELK